MHQLEPARLARARPLIPPAHEAGHTTFAHAIIEGFLPGRVFVDEAGAPRSAFFCADDGFLLATGEANAAFADAAIAALQADYLGGLQEARSLVATTAAWADVLRAIIPGQAARLEFHHRGVRAPVPPLPAGYRLEPVSIEAARRFGEGIDPWVVRTLGGPGEFAAKSFGAVVRADGGALAAACLACAIGGGEAEIEIGTDPRHRKRGLAVVAGAAFIAACRERGLAPAWTCDATNVPSLRTAKRLGFEPFREAAVFPLSPQLIRAKGGGWELATRSAAETA